MRRYRTTAFTQTACGLVLGGSESYVSLCRRHWTQGKLGPDQPEQPAR